MASKARKKQLTTLQGAVLLILALTVSLFGISAVGTDSEILHPSDALFKNSQTVSLL